MIKIILWDIDGTILNFKRAEAAAVRAEFAEFGLGECTDEMLADYSQINARYWKILERGEMTKAEILVKRFEEFFGKYGIHADDISSFNSKYQLALGDTICFNDDALDIIKSIDRSIGQYAVTNGTAAAQQKKIDRSGLDKLLDGIFISDVVGYEKPDVRFFEPVFDTIRRDYGEVMHDEIMIIGDSLTSDILGANRVGIKSCWYNPHGEENTNGTTVDYEIKNLAEVPRIIDENR